MHRIARPLAIAAFGLLLLAPAVALAEGCVTELLGEQRPGALGLARIAGDQRAWFQPAPTVCAPNDVGCRGRSYVVKGDIVVTGATEGGFTCVLFPNAAGGAEGWMPVGRLAALSASPTGGWPGDWTRDAGAFIRLSAAGAQIAVVGEGMWQGATPSAVHTGEIQGRARPTGDTLRVGYDVCNATLRRLGPYLAVGDNGGCGGMNVTFVGVYRRDR